MKSLIDLEKEAEVAREALNKILTYIRERKAETIVQCESSSAGDGCGMGHKIKDIVYIQTHWYTPPRGCTGGDYWNAGEGNFVCPSCGCRNRLYNRPDIEEKCSLFKEIVKEHKD